MPSDQNLPTSSADAAAKDRAPEPRPLTPAAQRALAEAAARRAARGRLLGDQPPEMHGRGGLEPTRYGDWEVNGLTSDF